MRSPIHRWFAAVAQTAETRVALHTPHGDATFGELVSAARTLADALATLGCTRADRIAILATDHRAIATALLGILEAGCVFAPLDPATPDARLHAQLAKLGCRAIVDANGHLLVRGEDRPIQRHEIEGSCSIYFTSGSTGAPRAILGRLSAIAHHVAWEIDYLGLDASVRGAIVHSPSYDAYLPDLFVPMCAGGVACAPPAAIALDPEWLDDEGITLLHCVPSVFRSLLARPEAARLTRLRHVLLAGEVVRPVDVALARRVLPNVRLVNLYGPSEATLVKLHHEITTADADAASVPIGRPMPDVSVHVLDDDNRPCVDGAVGQIAIQSPYGSLGYVDEPELTRARFLDVPGSGEQIYLTGDYGARLPDGSLAFTGRRDRQLKLYGARVDLDEVEAILASCDGVVESVVIADDAAPILHGFVVLDGTVEIARVRESAMQRVSPAMRLARLRVLENVPRTTSGKIDRRRIAAELVR